MKLLIVKTEHPTAVQDLMEQHDLAEHHRIERGPGVVTIRHMDDAISQELYFWFALAKGCGLVEDYELEAWEGR